MPPNLSVKPTFERVELENFENNNCDEKDEVRTVFILRNIYSYLLRNRYRFKAVCAVNKKEEFVMIELKGTVSDFQMKYGANVKVLCTEVEFTEETIRRVLNGIANELFSSGITWSRMIALFVFVGEFALLCLSRKFPEKVVDEIYECFSRFVKENLEDWVDHHGGWDGLTTLSFAKQGNTKMLQGNTNMLESPQTSNTGWAKTLLYSTVRMVGTLAHIANSSSHILP